jgi:hypothetical protein
VFPKSAQLLGRFHRDSRGNIAVIFALTLIPLLSRIRCAIDAEPDPGPLRHRLRDKS